MTLIEFLLARIAEDEARAERWTRPVTRINDADLWGEVGVRVLAECEAKRLIAEAHESGKATAGPFCIVCGVGTPCRTLRFFALPYADHPDYREDWRP